MGKQTQPSTPIGQVSLFTGCTSHILDANTIDDAWQLLNLCGYTVSTPTEQVCCGALPHHKGLLDTAKQCEQNNIKAFEHIALSYFFNKVITILLIHSGKNQGFN